MLSSSVFVGFQSGVYLHFNEEYSGGKKHLLVSIPILATGSINLFNIKSNHVGVSLAAGKNFFHMDLLRMILKMAGCLIYRQNILLTKRIFLN